MRGVRLIDGIPFFVDTRACLVERIRYFKYSGIKKGFRKLKPFNLITQ